MENDSQKKTSFERDGQRYERLSIHIKNELLAVLDMARIDSGHRSRVPTLEMIITDWLEKNDNKVYIESYRRLQKENGASSAKLAQGRRRIRPKVTKGETKEV